MKTRRGFLAYLTAACTVPLDVFGQQPIAKIPRVGVLLYNSPDVEPIGSLLQGLQALNRIDGKTITVDYRFAHGRGELLPALAAELVSLKPDVIVAFGGDVAPQAQKATSTIPIVALVSNDPVESKLVASVGRPGANLTGMTMIYNELAGKVVQLLKEAVPSISRVAVLWNPDHADPEYRETRRAAAGLGVDILSLEVRKESDFQPAFETALRERAEGLLIISTRLLTQHRKMIVDFGLKNQIIMAGNWGDWTKDGLLFTYGPDMTEMMSGLAVYVDKVLKGTNPADIPMQRPTRFHLIVNLKAAKSLAIVVPESILARADELIQ